MTLRRPTIHPIRWQMDFITHFAGVAICWFVFLLFVILQALHWAQQPLKIGQQKRRTQIFESLFVKYSSENIKNTKQSEIGAIKYIWRPFTLYCEIMTIFVNLLIYFNSSKEHAMNYFGIQLFFILFHQFGSGFLTYHLETRPSLKDAFFQLCGLSPLVQLYKQVYNDQENWQMRQVVKFQASLLSLPSMLLSLIFSLSTGESIGQWYLAHIIGMSFSTINLTFAFYYEDSFGLTRPTLCWRVTLWLFRFFNISFRCWLWATIATYVNYTASFLIMTGILCATIFYQIQEEGIYRIHSDAEQENNRLRKLKDIVFESVSLYFTFQLQNMVLYCRSKEKNQESGVKINKDSYYYITLFQFVELVILISVLVLRATSDVPLSVNDDSKVQMDVFQIFVLRLGFFLFITFVLGVFLVYGGCYDFEFLYIIKHGTIEELLKRGETDKNKNKIMFGEVLELLVIRKDILQMTRQQLSRYVELVFPFAKETMPDLETKEKFTIDVVMDRILRKRYFSPAELALLKFPQNEVLKNLDFESELMKPTAEALKSFNLKFKENITISQADNQLAVSNIAPLEEEASADCIELAMIPDSQNDDNNNENSDVELKDLQFLNITSIEDLAGIPTIVVEYTHKVGKYEFSHTEDTWLCSRFKHKDEANEYKYFTFKMEQFPDPNDPKSVNDTSKKPNTMSYSFDAEDNTSISKNLLSKNTDSNEITPNEVDIILPAENRFISRKQSKWRYVLHINETKDLKSKWIELEEGSFEDHRSPYTCYELEKRGKTGQSNFKLVEEAYSKPEELMTEILELEDQIDELIKKDKKIAKAFYATPDEQYIDYRSSNWNTLPDSTRNMKDRFCTPFAFTWLCCCPCLGYLTTRRLLGCRYGGKLTMRQIMHNTHKRKVKPLDDLKPETEKNKYIVNDGDIFLYADAEPDYSWLALAQSGNWCHCGIVVRYKENHVKYLPKRWQAQIQDWKKLQLSVDGEDPAPVLEEGTPLVFEISNYGRWYYGDSYKCHLTHLEHEIIRNKTRNRWGATIGFREYTGPRDAKFYSTLYYLMHDMQDKHYNTNFPQYVASAFPCLFGYSLEKPMYYCSEQVARLFIDLDLAHSDTETVEFGPSDFGMQKACCPFCYWFCGCITCMLAPWLAFFGGNTCRTNALNVNQFKLKHYLGRLYILMNKSVKNYKEEEKEIHDERNFCPEEDVYNKDNWFHVRRPRLYSQRHIHSKFKGATIAGYPEQVDLSIQCVSALQILIFFVMFFGIFAMVLVTHGSNSHSSKCMRQIMLVFSTMSSLVIFFMLCRFMLDEDEFMSGFIDYELLYMFYYGGFLFGALEDTCNFDPNNRKKNDFFYYFYKSAFYYYGFKLDEDNQKDEDNQELDPLIPEQGTNRIKKKAISQIGALKSTFIQVFSISLGIMTVVIIRGLNLDNRNHSITFSSDPFIFTFIGIGILYVTFQAGKKVIEASLRIELDIYPSTILPAHFYSTTEMRRVVKDSIELASLRDANKKIAQLEGELDEMKRKVGEFDEFKREVEDIVQGKVAELSKNYAGQVMNMEITPQATDLKKVEASRPTIV